MELKKKVKIKIEIKSTGANDTHMWVTGYTYMHTSV